MSQINDVKEQILALENQRMQAMMDADTEALKLILSDGLTYIHTTAAVDSKQSLMERLEAGSLKYESIATEGVLVRTYGDVVIVTGNATMKVSARGQRISFGIRYTDVYAKQDGSWRMVAWQSTRKPEG